MLKNIDKGRHVNLRKALRTQYGVAAPSSNCLIEICIEVKTQKDSEGAELACLRPEGLRGKLEKTWRQTWACLIGL